MYVCNNFVLMIRGSPPVNRTSVTDGCARMYSGNVVLLLDWKV